MKNIRTLVLAFLCLVFLVSCQDSIIDPVVEIRAPVEKSRKLGPDKILIQTFLTTEACENVIPDDFCVCQEGSGSAVQLGNIYVFLNFCITGGGIDLGYVDYELTPDESYIELGNGDQYFLEGSGTVILTPDHPNYDAYFNDEFSFHYAIIDEVPTSDVSGFLKTNSQVYNQFTDHEYTEHNLHGFIQL